MNLTIKDRLIIGNFFKAEGNEEEILLQRSIREKCEITVDEMEDIDLKLKLFLIIISMRLIAIKIPSLLMTIATTIFNDLLTLAHLQVYPFLLDLSYRMMMMSKPKIC